MREPSRCQVCGAEAPLKFVEFRYNIGMLVRRFTRSIHGYMCKGCIHRNFWKFTLLDLTLGWWGYISLVMTPIFFVNNVIQYLGALTLPSASRKAAAPTLSDKDIATLAPHARDMTVRLNRGEPLGSVAADIAVRTGIKATQVVLYVKKLAASQKQSSRG